MPPTNLSGNRESGHQQRAPSNGEFVSFARDAGLVGAALVGTSLLGFVRLPILTKGLGADSFGTWATILAAVSLLTPLAVLGLREATVRFLAAEKDKDRIRDDFLSVVFVVLAAGSILSLIVVLCSGPLASLSDDPDNSSLFILGSFMIITHALSLVTLAYFRTFRQMKWFSFLRIGTAMCDLGLLACFVSLGWGVEGAIAASLASGALLIAICLFIALRQVGIALPSFSKIGSYLKYGLPLVPGAAAMWIIHISDRYMILHFMESSDVGVYHAAYGLAGLLTMLLVPVGTVLFPTVSKSYDEGDMDKTKKYFKYSHKYLMMLSIPAAFGISVLAVPLLRLLTTDEFVSGSNVVPLVASGLVVYNVYQICVYIIGLAKKTHLVLRLLSISAGLNIVLNFLLIPHMGILGAAVATLVSFTVLAILTAVVGFRYLRFDLSWLFLVRSLLASTIMSSAIWFFDPQSMTQVVLSILLGVVLYFGLMILFKSFNRDEIALLKDLVRQSNRASTSDLDGPAP
jgi:O-antigen/teichoic acid export membrane protein